MQSTTQAVDLTGNTKAYCAVTASGRAIENRIGLDSAEQDSAKEIGPTLLGAEPISLVSPQVFF